MLSQRNLWLPTIPELACSRLSDSRENEKNCALAFYTQFFSFSRLSENLQQAMPECVRLTTDEVIIFLVDQRGSKIKLVGHFKNKRRCIVFLGPLVAAL